MFNGWASFFALIGSAAASLTGLLFVVVTLTTGRERSQILRATGIYMTPIILKFAVVLACSALALIPPPGAKVAAPLIALCGAAGLAAAARTILGVRAFSKSADPLHWSDLWGYGVLPAALYLALIAVGAALAAQARPAVWWLALVLLGLLLTAIRNAWDLITWMAPRSGASGP